MKYKSLTNQPSIVRVTNWGTDIKIWGKIYCLKCITNGNLKIVPKSIHFQISFFGKISPVKKKVGTQVWRIAMMRKSYSWCHTLCTRKKNTCSKWTEQKEKRKKLGIWKIRTILELSWNKKKNKNGLYLILTKDF